MLKTLYRGPKTALPIGAKPLNDMAIRTKYAHLIRWGKSEKDKATGSHASRFANRDARVAWQKDARATNATFPGKTA
jgi:hypothetical protein